MSVMKADKSTNGKLIMGKTNRALLVYASYWHTPFSPYLSCNNCLQFNSPAACTTPGEYSSWLGILLSCFLGVYCIKPEIIVSASRGWATTEQQSWPIRRCRAFARRREDYFLIAVEWRFVWCMEDKTASVMQRWSKVAWLGLAVCMNPQ